METKGRHEEGAERRPLKAVFFQDKLKKLNALADLVASTNHLWWGRIMREFRGHYGFMKDRNKIQIGCREYKS